VRFDIESATERVDHWKPRQFIRRDGDVHLQLRLSVCHFRWQKSGSHLSHPQDRPL